MNVSTTIPGSADLFINSKYLMKSFRTIGINDDDNTNLYN